MREARRMTEAERVRAPESPSQRRCTVRMATQGHILRVDSHCARPVSDGHVPAPTNCPDVLLGLAYRA
eukprot:15441035-Alexandrium_andersonii.AAC.1